VQGIVSYSFSAIDSGQSRSIRISNTRHLPQRIDAKQEQSAIGFHKMNAAGFNPPINSADRNSCYYCRPFGRHQRHDRGTSRTPGASRSITTTIDDSDLVDLDHDFGSFLLHAR
jgi:hypothetical protein